MPENPTADGLWSVVFGPTIPGNFEGKPGKLDWKPGNFCYHHRFYQPATSQCSSKQDTKCQQAVNYDYRNHQDQPEPALANCDHELLKPEKEILENDHWRGQKRVKQPPSAVTIGLFILLIFCQIMLTPPVLCATNSVKTMDILSKQPQISVSELEVKIQECNMTKICTETELNVSPICGSDGRTYNSMCEIKRAACHGNPVYQKFKGPCSDKVKCPLAREYQLTLRNKSNSEFIPDCEADGSFSPVQCHQATGFCWCTSSNGLPTPGTSVQFKRPNCFPQGKVGRRSSRRQLGAQSRVCGTIDRTHFQNNLIRMFTTEYDRQRKHRKQRANVPVLYFPPGGEAYIQGAYRKAPPQGAGANKDDIGVIFSPEKRVIIWKFGELDVNRDSRLSQRELRSLKRLVKKVVAPRSCAKVFTRYCDQNQDRRLTRGEWSVCLGVDINTSYGAFLSLSPQKEQAASVAGLRGNLRAKALERPQADRLHAASLWAATSSNSNSVGGGSPSLLKEKMSNDMATTSRPPEDENLDCKTQRLKALKAALTEVGTYIPECIGPNSPLFQKVQCHRSAGYCWCSDEVTGRPVPGTSMRYGEGRPECDRRSSITMSRLEIKKCPEKKRRKFMLTLHARFESNMIASSGKLEMDTATSKREQASKWKFNQLDTNKNGRLERREWKELRRELKILAGIRRCGRNFLQHCAGDDKRISFGEWLQCTLDSDDSQHPNTRRPGKGPNPFEHVLKPDQ